MAWYNNDMYKQKKNKEEEKRKNNIENKHKFLQFHQNVFEEKV